MNKRAGGREQSIVAVTLPVHVGNRPGDSEQEHYSQVLALL